MKTTIILPILGAVLVQGVALAQNDIPLLRPEEREAVDAQTNEFNQSLVPALTAAAKSTVRVWVNNHRMAYGTVIGDGNQVLTKWSEILRAKGALRVEASSGAVHSASISGVYADEDLAVLKLNGMPLTPVKWSPASPPLGGFLIASQPDGRPAAFGVVSVLERNLRDADQAFLGVMGSPDFPGPGVKIREVTPDSGAAAAGLQAEDVILKVGTRTISGLLELKNSLVGVEPGSTVSLQVRRRGRDKKFDVLLGNRPPLPDFPGDRLRQMEHMGGALSRVRDSFSNVIQTDMRPEPNQIGGPVVDLKGQVVGISMARADRTRSFVMPTAAVEELLKTPAQDPSLAQVRQADKVATLPARRMAVPGGGRRMPRGSEERMRRHLSEMQRLMEFMREEMDGLEPSR